MDKFKKCKKRNLGQLKKTKTFIKKKKKLPYVNSSNSSSPNDFITNVIIKYINQRKYEKRKNGGNFENDKFNEFIGNKNATELLKERLFGKNEIRETDIVKNCLLFNDKNEILEKVSYKILYDVIKKCIDHEHVLMKVEELGFTAENIRDKNNENVNICSKYKAEVFFNYIYKNLKVIKITKNFQMLYKFMNVIISVTHIIPYMYKVRFIFSFCSIFNIYQKECENGVNSPSLIGKAKIRNDKEDNNNHGSGNFFNSDVEEFLNLFFELMNELINLHENYNTYDDNYKIFNFFVLRWILVYFQNKQSFFAKGKFMNSLIKLKYVMLLFTLLKFLHESANNVTSKKFKDSEGKVCVLNNITIGVCKEGTNVVHVNNQEEEERNISQFLNEHSSFFVEEKLDSNKTNFLDHLCNSEQLKNEKIKNNRDEIKMLMENFYDKVDLRLEKSLKDVKETMNTLTQNIFMTVYNLFNTMHLIHRHVVLLHFSFHFLKTKAFEYSYFIIFNAFQWIEKLLTVNNFVIHPMIFLTAQEVFTFYENIVIHLYKEKNYTEEEEFYQFYDKFNSKHSNVYSTVLKKIWSLYMLIISDEYMKREEVGKLSENPYFIINKMDEETDLMNSLNKLTTVLRVNNLEFPEEYKNLILKGVDETYKNCLTNCLSKLFRVLGLNTFFEEYFFFSSKELLSKDVYIINRILKDTNRTYHGGNFKFLMNFFYPLLMYYIDLYEKEEEHSIKKKLFLTHIKNVLIHFSRVLNDCINLYYFLSTNMEDLYILVTKFINCNDFKLLPLFINFFENFYLSTLKINNNQGSECISQIFDNNKIVRDIKCKYTILNLKKNNFFLSQVSDNLLKIFLPRFISIVTSNYENKFSQVNVKTDESSLNMSMVIEGFSKLIHVALYFSSDANLSEISSLLEQLIQRNEIEKEIYSLISILIVLKILIPFFTYDELIACSSHYKKLIYLVNEMVSNKLLLIGRIKNARGNRWNVNSTQIEKGKDAYSRMSSGGNNFCVNQMEQSTKLFDQNLQENNNSAQYYLPKQVSETMYTDGIYHPIGNENGNPMLNNNYWNRNITTNTCDIDPCGDTNQMHENSKEEEEEEEDCMLHRKNQRSYKKNLRRGKKDQSSSNIGKRSKIKNFIKKKKKNNNCSQMERLRRTKITKEIKMDVEKYKFIKMLIYDNVASMFKYFGNIFLKKNHTTGFGSGDDGIKNPRGSLCLNKNEMHILNSIYSNSKVTESKLPVMLTKENIFLFFENLDNYNINKYIKKFYVYLNSLLFYLNECKHVDRDYCYDLFFKILPITMKSLFYINKKFTAKLGKNSFFEHIIKLGSSNLKKLFLHVTPGLLMEEASCKKTAIHLLHLLIKRYKIEYDDQVQLFSVCLALSNASEKNLLKVFLKFLLSCVYRFNKDVILDNITQLTKLLNDISEIRKGVKKYTIENFLLRLHYLVSKSEQVVEQKQNPYDIIVAYLSKHNRKIFNKLVHKKNFKSGNSSDDGNDMNDYLNGKEMEHDKKRKKIKRKGTHVSLSSSDEGSSVISYAISEDDDVSSDSSGKSSYNDGLLENGKMAKKANEDPEKWEEHKIMENDKRKNKLNRKKSNKATNHDVKIKSQNRNLTKFFENLKNTRGSKETTYIKSTLDNILQRTPKKNRNNKNNKHTNIKVNKKVSDVLNNLGISLFKKKPNIAFTNQKEINDLFGKQYFTMQSLRKEKTNPKGKHSVDFNFDDEEEEEEAENVEIGLDGKIIVHPANSISQTSRNKKKDEMINRKYNHVNEKQNIHSKFRLHNKSKYNKKKANNFVTADKKLYTSKKGKGDIIKKDKLLPYSYVELKPLMTKEKFRTKTLHAFRSIKNNSKRRGRKRKN
ncbi:hypothetical protein, conserved [Plasmodium gonderi]|uniref:Uncharacterized protein n=1 Tax=Plasmodium gonderi TaxID=77519 RepID=A0A1Y1JHI4_PLAGO|nr:hypothetical protein, conserved [Plasmodium gonderi]GAW81108.1 hypothetical protein, conserved [Plasmodium gonderi]